MPTLAIAIVAFGIVVFVLMSALERWRPTVRHYPPRHVCGDCKALWTEGHICIDTSQRPPLQPPLRGTLVRRYPRS